MQDLEALMMAAFHFVSWGLVRPLYGRLFHDHMAGSSGIPKAMRRCVDTGSIEIEMPQHEARAAVTRGMTACASRALANPQALTH